MPPLLVSVLIPCYQQGALLAGAFESVLAQSYPHWQIVIVNDGSTDGTALVADALVAREPSRIRCIHQRNRGQAHARQAALEQAAGHALVMLDADDRLEPAMMEQCVAALEAAPKAAAAIANAWLVDEVDHVLRQFDQARPTGWPQVLESNPYGALAAAMVRADAVRAVGGLAFEGTPGCEDWDLWARLARCGYGFTFVDALLARYRQSAGNYSRRAEAMLDSAISLLDACRANDPRLANAPRPPAPPLTGAAYARLRNGRVMHAFGLAAVNGRSEEACARILERLAPGSFDPAYSRTQFRWGCHYGLLIADGGEQVERLPPQTAANLVRQAMKRCGLDRWAGQAERFTARILASPSRPAPLIERLARRFRNWF